MPTCWGRSPVRAAHEGLAVPELLRGRSRNSPSGGSKPVLRYLRALEPVSDPR